MRVHKTAAFRLGYEHALASMTKQARSTYGHELVGGIPWYFLGGIGGPADEIGYLLGSLNGRDLSDEEIEKLTESRDNWENWMPGVGAYRRAQRAGATNTAVVNRAKELGVKKVRPSRHSFTEFGSLVNPLNWVGTPVGLVVGATSKKHRTLDEQVEHDAVRQSLKNILIPGYGGYNMAKRVGASRDVVEKDRKPDKDDESRKKDKKKKDGEDDGE